MSVSSVMGCDKRRVRVAQHKLIAHCELDSHSNANEPKHSFRNFNSAVKISAQIFAEQCMLDADDEPV